MATSRPPTRSSTGIWLIGQPLESLKNSVLPSKREAIALFFNYKIKGKQNVKQAVSSVTSDVLKVWEAARIPTQARQHVIKKLQSLYDDWLKLKKNKENKKKQSENLLNKQTEWNESLDNLFDIAHADALNIIDIEDDKKFLLLQREPKRKGKMAGEDKKFAKNIENLNKAYSEKNVKLLKQKKREISDFDDTVQLVSTDSSSVTSAEHSHDEDVTNDPNEPSTSRLSSSKEKATSKLSPQRKKVKLMDKKLLASFDIAKVSNRNASLIMIPTVSNLGYDPEEMRVSYSTIRRKRQEFRKEVSAALKSELKLDFPLVIHWDGKLLEDISGEEIVDRLPVLVSGNGVEQLLGVPKLNSGTGDNTSTAVYDLIIDWGLFDKVKCMCFDTTASNTGRKSGACILLEQKMGKDLLWLPCRHHIFEIILESVVSISLPASSGPNIQLFKRFKVSWPKLNKDSFRTANDDPNLAARIAETKDNLILFANGHLSKQQPRDDYKELLELAIIFVGGTPTSGIKFRKPGAYHRARWMAKIIYSLKIWMFKPQFNLTKTEEKGLANTCCFVVEVYLKSWYTAPVPCSAPRNDLELLKVLAKYKEVDEKVASNATKKMLNHLWYLSEELVAFAFFDDDVSIEMKNKMRMALENPSEPNNIKKSTLDIAVIEQKQLDDFVTSHTKVFFEILDLPSSFLESNAENWQLNEEYLKARKMVMNVKVVNDLAERGVKLMDDYNKILTNDEEQKQYLLQVVQKYRSELPNRNKKTIISFL